MSIMFSYIHHFLISPIWKQQYKLLLNFLQKFHWNQKLIRKLQTLWSIAEIETHIGEFSNYNLFIIFNSLLIDNISITIYRNVSRIMSQCRQIRCSIWPPPSPTTFSNCIHYWLIELLMNIIILLKALRCLHIACLWCLRSSRVYFSSCPKLHNQVYWRRTN